MSFIQALILGLVQGVTEFLPVSSSGHLAILENLFEISNDTGIAFDVVLHLGTLAAIFAAFRKDIRKLILEGCKSIFDVYENVKIYIHNKDKQDAKRYKKIISNNYRKVFLLILVSTIPTAIEGFLFRNFVAQAGTNLLAPAVGLFITGVMLLVIDFFPTGTKIPKDVGYGTALIIGICQGIAVFPGISRSGITIVACLICGFNRKFAVKYSFLMAIPAIIGAAVLECVKIPGSGVTLGLFGMYAVSAIVAGIVGYFCIQGMLLIIRKKQFRFFSLYCFMIGIAAAACNFAL